MASEAQIEMLLKIAKGKKIPLTREECKDLDNNQIDEKLIVLRGGNPALKPKPMMGANQDSVTAYNAQHFGKAVIKALSYWDERVDGDTNSVSLKTNTMVVLHAIVGAEKEAKRIYPVSL